MSGNHSFERLKKTSEARHSFLSLSSYAKKAATFPTLTVVAKLCDKSREEAISSMAANVSRKANRQERLG